MSSPRSVIAQAATEKRHATWQETLQQAKKKHRPKLADWTRDGFATRRRTEVERLDAVPKCALRITRVDAGIAPDDFAKRFERRSEPCLVTNVPEQEGWALRNWTSINGRPTNRGDLDVFRMKVGEDDDGKTLRVSLKDFVSYARFNRDDSPLYVFDQAFCEKHGRDFYSIPKFCARDDLFELVGEKRRPPYQWFLLGPQRSGTCVHIDPLGTAAWNTLLAGRKRWVLFEPGTSKKVATGSHLVKAGEDDEAVNYFVDILPRIRQTYPHARRIEVVQRPGDTLYVPAGWWHAVLNLDDTVAVTQNFVSRSSFDGAWDRTRSGRKGMARAWLAKLEASDDPELRALADRAKLQPPVPRIV